MKNNGIYIHLTFATKYREKTFLDNELKEIIAEIINKVCFYIQLSLIALAVDDDHVHILFEFDPSLKISGIVCRLKAISSKRWNALFDSKGCKLWQRSYAIESVSIKNKVNLINYLNHHNLVEV